MKPDACIDLLKTLESMGAEVGMTSRKMSINGVDVVTHSINARKGDSICLYEFIGNIFYVNDMDKVRMFTDISDIVFTVDNGLPEIKAVMIRELPRTSSINEVIYEEVIYGRQEGEYVVRTV